MATISFITKIDLTLTPTQFVFTDSTDYVSQGVALADVNGCFRIIAPSGVTIYDNTDFSDSGCDIKVSTSVIDQKEIPTGTLELGNYIITYTVYDIVLLTYSTITYTYDNEYVSPTIEITQFVNVIASLYSQTDDTDYVVNGKTPTMVRVNKLVYPPGIEGGPPAPITTTAATLRTNVVYNGPATAIITNYVTYTFDDGLIVVANLFGSQVLNINGSFYCSVMCGLKAYGDKTKNCDEKLRTLYENNFKLATSYLTLVMGLIDCNGGDKIDTYLGYIVDIIGDCNCGCDDSDDNFSRITGWGTIIGADGEDGVDGVNGTLWYSGVTTPPGGTGVIGDWYINTATGDIYKKTGTTSWTLELNIQGVPGAVILNNVTTGSATTSGTTDTTLLSFTTTAGQCDTNQDALLITSWVEKSVITDEFTFTLVINSVIFGTYTLPNGTKCARLRATITRESATTYFFESILSSFDASSGGYFTYGASGNTYSSGALTFANTIAIDAKMQRVSGSGTATSKQLSVIFLNK